VITRPTTLNEGEHTFVKDLRQWLDSDPALLDGAEVHLLRNERRTGTGSFEVGWFYPDFMLWVVRGDQQWLTFVDPKGLGRISDIRGWSKTRVWQTLREIEGRNPGLNVKLDSWLVSVSSKLDAPVEFQDDAAALANHIVFQKSDGDYIDRMFRAILDR